MRHGRAWLRRLEVVVGEGGGVGVGAGCGGCHEAPAQRRPQAGQARERRRVHDARLPILARRHHGRVELLVERVCETCARLKKFILMVSCAEKTRI